jgi:Eco29kI restriction endonuclease
MGSGNVYNPLDKENLGRSVVETLLRSSEVPLGGQMSFTGAGIYAIYYRGNFEPYAKLAKINKGAGVLPIYVGKAVPKGGRKGVDPLRDVETRALSARLEEHARSIRSVESLEIDAFSCRSLVVDDIWIPLGETLVIDRFKPLWNTRLDGFGNHDPGGGRYNGMRPAWDEIHPGRSWAMRCQPAKLGRDALLAGIENFMAAI